VKPLTWKLLLVGTSVAIAGCSSSASSKASSPTTASSASSQVASSPTSAAGGTASTGNPSSPVTLNESGSTLLYPFLQELVGPLKQAYPNITLAPGPGGSGKGISDAIAGLVQMGGSDAYLSPGQLSSNPGLMNVPIVISAQAINYNLPGITDLKLSGDVLAQIYEGKITKWNDPAIANLNPGVSLPATTIVPVRRVDASGDTFIFTSLLSATNSTWQNGPAFGTTVTWPAAPGELTANGNPGMVQTCKATPGCVAYIGVSSESAAQQAGLGEALLQNRAGNFLHPVASTIAAAAAAGAASVPDNLAAPLIYEPGANSYPIVNLEYLVIKTPEPSSDVALAIRTFLTWAISPSGGSQPQFLAKEDFVALPAPVVPKVEAAIAKITG